MQLETQLTAAFLRRPQWLAAAVLIAASGVSQTATAQPTVVDITDDVMRADAQRIGLHFGESNWYNAPTLKKVVEENFEGRIISIISSVSSVSDVQVDLGSGPVTVSQITLDDVTLSTPEQLFDGQYTICDGPSQWATGTIIAIDATGKLITLDQVVSSDVTNIVLQKHRLNDGAMNLAPQSWAQRNDLGAYGGSKSNGDVSFAQGDVPPGSFGNSALLLAGTAAEANISWFGPQKDTADTSGTWHVRLWAKAASGTPTFEFGGTGAPGGIVTQPITGTWQQYETTMTVTNPRSAVGLNVIVNGGDVLIDEVEMWKAGDTNPSPYTDEAVSVLQFYNPGCMRLLLNIGDTARNRMAPRMLTYQSESADNHGGKGVKTDGHAFFALCKELNCAPWIELPGNMVRDDILWMMEYVAGDGTTAGGADRIAWGQVEPWTDVLPSIYIDLGNESATFNGRSPDVASNYWEGLISAAKASPHYDSKVKFFIQGQGAAYLNVPNTPSADGLHQHGYIGRSLDLQELEDYLYTDELLFKFIWAHPYWLATVDAFASPGSLGSLADNYGLMPVAYETGNYHYTFGDAPSEVRDRFIAGIGGQISAFNLMLFRQKEYGFMAQNKFNFSQDSFIGTGSFGDGAEARLWGNIISPVNPATRRYRPGYLAGHLANEVIYGDMMVTAHLGNDPTFDSTGLFKNRKLTNRGPEITVEDVPELYTYAFKDGDKRSIVMTLLSFEDRPVQLDFAGGALNQQATVRMLTGPAVDANNEPDFGPSEAQVFVTESVLTDFESGYQITVPKYSMMSIEWTEDGSGSNVAPVAEAGPDQAIVDNDGSGSEQVALNGFSSSDPDGSIVAYVWRENGSDLSGIANPVVTLPVGVHTLYLTVTDNQGATNTDTLTVEVIADTVPSITTAAFPAGSATRAYSAAVAVEGGNAPLTYSLLGAPAWMNIDPATGEITGTPPALGTFNPVVIVVDGDGDSDSISLQVTVGTPPAELYADDFADNDISDWTVIRDNGNDAWSAQDGAIYYPTNTGVFPIDLSKFNLIAYDGGSAWSDYTLEFDMVTVNDDDRMGAVVYFVDSENFLGTAANQQSNTYEIFKVEGGVYSELASMSGSYQTGVVESVTVTVENGGNLSVTDGTVNLSAPVPAGFTGGSIGFVTYYQQSTSFDNVVVTPLNPVVPNNAPIADAGNSLAVNDANDDGMANVSLDGSASSDNDGTIVSFVWKNGGSQIATGAAPAVALPVGAHTLELLVTDNAGATNADLVEVTVYGPASMAIIGTLAPFSNTEGSASLSQSLTVSGSNLVGDLIISAPSGFELSLDDSIYGPTLQMPASGGVVDPTVVYIRLADNPAGSYGGAINLGSGEANAVSSFTVEGTTTSAPAVPEPAVASLFVGLGVLLRVMRTRRR